MARGSASAQLLELAELLGAPVVMTSNGKGSIDDRHPLAFNGHSGLLIRDKIDVAFGVGTRFLDGASNPNNYGFTTTIHLEIDPEEMDRNFTPDIALLGDVKVGLQAVIDEIKRIGVSAGDRSDVLAAARAESLTAVNSINPQSPLAHAIRSEMPDDGIVVSEMTQLGYWGNIGFPVYHPNTWLTPGYQGTLGNGFCTALGAKVGNPDKVVVSINGDGGFGFTMNELATMSQHNIAAIAVVFNDSAYGNVKRIQKVDLGGKEIASTLKNPDFVKLADAHDITGRRATSPEALKQAIKESIAANEPTLIEVPVEEMPNPWKVLGIR